MSRENEQGKRIVVGVDLHPDSLSAAVAMGSCARDMEVKRIFTKVDLPEWDAFLARNVPKGSVLVFEASGNSFGFAEQCRGHGHVPVVMDSAACGRIAKAYCKTDPKDARRMAKIYLCGLAEEVWIPDEQTRTAREAVSSYEMASRNLTRANNKIKMFLNGRRVRLGKARKNLGCKSNRDWILSSREWSPTHKEILGSMLSDYDHAAEQKRRLYQLMAREVFANPSMAMLMKFCGIRVITAYCLMASIGDVNRFSTPKKLVAYLGLAPTIIQSGAKSHAGGIQRSGRNSARTSLVEAGQAIMNSKRKSAGALKRWGLKLSIAKGSKCHAAAAVARKLAVAIWYALKGFMPELIRHAEDLNGKLLGIARELTQDHAKRLGFKTCKDLAEEYTRIVILAGGTGGGG